MPLFRHSSYSKRPSAALPVSPPAPPSAFPPHRIVFCLTQNWAYAASSPLRQGYVFRIFQLSLWSSPRTSSHSRRRAVWAPTVYSFPAPLLLPDINLALHNHWYYPAIGTLHKMRSTTIPPGLRLYYPSLHGYTSWDHKPIYIPLWWPPLSTGLLLSRQ